MNAQKLTSLIVFSVAVAGQTTFPSSALAQFSMFGARGPVGAPNTTPQATTPGTTASGTIANSSLFSGHSGMFPAASGVTAQPGFYPNSSYGFRGIPGPQAGGLGSPAPTGLSPAGPNGMSQGALVSGPGSASNSAVLSGAGMSPFASGNPGQTRFGNYLAPNLPLVQQANLAPMGSGVNGAPGNLLPGMAPTGSGNPGALPWPNLRGQSSALPYVRGSVAPVQFPTVDGVVVEQAGGNMILRGQVGSAALRSQVGLYAEFQPSINSVVNDINVLNTMSRPGVIRSFGMSNASGAASTTTSPVPVP